MLAATSLVRDLIVACPVKCTACVPDLVDAAVKQFADSHEKVLDTAYLYPSSIPSFLGLPLHLIPSSEHRCSCDESFETNLKFRNLGSGDLHCTMYGLYDFGNATDGVRSHFTCTDAHFTEDAPMCFDSAYRAP